MQNMPRNRVVPGINTHMGSAHTHTHTYLPIALDNAAWHNYPAAAHTGQMKTESKPTLDTD